MAANKRTSFQREHDLRKVAELYLRGLTQLEIAQQLSVSRQQIGYDLKVLQRRWHEAGQGDFQAKKVQELAKVDALERIYWQAWDDSKKIRETTTSTTEKSGSQADAGAKQTPLRMKAALRKEARDGNPEFLKGVQWCITKRCAILGLDAPSQSVLAGPDGQAFKVYLGFDAEKEV
jgi:hypothetical protein